jgi:hypothetical protein
MFLTNLARNDAYLLLNGPVVRLPEPASATAAAFVNRSYSTNPSPFKRLRVRLIK